MIKTFEFYLDFTFFKKNFKYFFNFFALIFILNLLEEINFFKDLEIILFFQ